MFLYKIVTSLVYCFLYPVLRVIFYKHGIKQRTTFRNLYIDESIWIHAASLGEVNAITPLLRRLVETYNNKTFVLTCMTKTGIAAAKEVSKKLIVLQFPLDISHIMSKAFREFNPTLIILVETEMWPNMLNQAYKRKVPVIVVNARLSQKTYKKYRLFKWFFMKEFSAIKLVCAQSERDAEKFRQLKFKNVINANNLKFSISLPNHEMHILRHAWNYKFNDFIVAFGCSRPGEEQLMKKIYDRLIPLIPRLKVIITPRHLHRMPEVVSLFTQDEYALFSESNTSKPFLIVDEFGILPQVYALADVVVIGGSFCNFGGHNPLEAVWYEKPIIIGEYHQSCIGTVEKLLAEKAIVVSNPEKLFNDIFTLYQNIEHRIQIGKQAKKILLDNQHALDNHWEALTQWIHK